MYQRDIFHDAFPKESTDEKGAFLGPDFITPHKHPRTGRLDVFTEPVPIQFLKIMPEVTIGFQFDLKSGLLDAEAKLTLFAHLLQLKGVGAKTNVGYGRLIEPPKPVVYERGQKLSGKVRKILGNVLTVYVEDLAQTFEIKVKDSKVDFRNKHAYKEGNTYEFTVSSVTEKGQVKYLRG